MADRLIKGLSKDKELRFFAADVTETAREGCSIHSLSPVKSVIFGKLLCAGLLFGADLKDERFLVTLKTEFRNLEDYIIVTANNRGRVKGYPHLIFREDDKILEEKTDLYEYKKIREEIRSMLKDGVLTVIKDIGMKKPYNGNTKLITGEIARDLTYYFSVSEQIPSIVGLSITLHPDGLIKKGVGFLVQLLPEASEKMVDLLEKNMRMLPEIIDLLEMGKRIEEILYEMVLKGIDYEITSETDTEYHCDCSKERFEKGLLMLGEDDLKELLSGEEPINLNCRYCSKTYTVTPEEAENIIRSARTEQIDKN